MNFAPKLAKTLLSAAAIALVTTTAWAATITVGGKNFTEQLIIAEITKQLLESKGHTVDKKDGMARRSSAPHWRMARSISTGNIRGRRSSPSTR